MDEPNGRTERTNLTNETYERNLRTRPTNETHGRNPRTNPTDGTTSGAAGGARGRAHGLLRLPARTAAGHLYDRRHRVDPAHHGRSRKSTAPSPRKTPRSRCSTWHRSGPRNITGAGSPLVRHSSVVRPFGSSVRFVRSVRPFGSSVRFVRSVRPSGSSVRFVSSVRPSGSSVPFVRYSNIGAITVAKLLRARLSRLLTVPRFTPVISEISSYVLPSSSRSTKTMR